jgi:outer membrane protein OmpA-like peptidoglycan-associated protein
MPTENKLELNASDALVKALDPSCQWREVDALIEQTEIGDINHHALAQAVRTLSRQSLIEVGRPARLKGRKAVRLTSYGAQRARYLASHAKSSHSGVSKASHTLAPFVLGALLTGCSTPKMSMPFQKPDTAGSYKQINTDNIRQVLPRAMTVPSEGSAQVATKPPGIFPEMLEVKTEVRPAAVPTIAPSATSAAKQSNDVRRQAIFFRSNSVEIGNQLRVLKGTDVNGKKPLRVRLLASTDSTGSVVANKRLAKARALAVASELMKMGIERKHIQIKLVPMGTASLSELTEGQFVPTSTDAIARRVEVEFVAKP